MKISLMFLLLFALPGFTQSVPKGKFIPVGSVCQSIDKHTCKVSSGSLPQVSIPFRPSDAAVAVLKIQKLITAKTVDGRPTTVCEYRKVLAGKNPNDFFQKKEVREFCNYWQGGQVELPAGTHRIEFIPTNLGGVQKYDPQTIDVTVGGGKTYLAKGVFSKPHCQSSDIRGYCTQTAQSWAVQVEPK